MALVLGTSYSNVFYENVLKKMRSIITTDRPCTVYISPSYRDMGSFSIRLWGTSMETDLMMANEWRKLYNMEIVLYVMGEKADERFYEQFYSDAERLNQLLFNNKTIDAATFPWHDGEVSEVLFNEFVEDEEEVDGLHVARYAFSCRLSRVD